MLLLRLFGATFSLALRRNLAHRANFLFDVAQSLIGVGAVLATVMAIFHQTTSLAGWSRAEALVLLGVFAIVSGLRAALIDPSMSTFVGTIRDGTLDEALLRPAPSWFTATCRDQAPLALGQAFIGIGIAIVGIRGLPQPPSPLNIVVAIVMIGCACIIAWSFSLIMASLGFWAARLELAPLTASLWDLGRYPASVYGRPLRIVVMYLVPLAGMVTLPAQTITGADPLASLVTCLAITLCFLSLSVALFRRGLKRYTGATS